MLLEAGSFPIRPVLQGENNADSYKLKVIALANVHHPYPPVIKAARRLL